MNETVVFTQHQKLLSPLELVWVLGTERGKRFLLVGGRQTFGRSEDNDIVLHDPTISNHHGVLVYVKDGEIIIYDTASRNGISLDGKKVPIITLKIGRQIQIGKVYLKLIRAGQEMDLVQPESKKFSLLWKKKKVLVALGSIFLLISGFLFIHTRGKTPPTVQNIGLPLTPVMDSQRPISRAKPVKAQGNLPKFTQKRRAVAQTTGKRVQDRGLGFVEASQISERAQSAFDLGRFEEAYVTWKKVLEKDPFNQEATQGLQKLNGVAGKIYEEILMATSPEESREKIRLALAISDPSSEIHRQTRELMSQGM